MQVSVEKAGGLERRLTVQVPAERIDSAIDERLQSLVRTVRLDGFRPGKVPLRVVRKRFGGQVRQEVLGEVIQESYQQALDQEQLNPAGYPQIEPKNHAPGEDFEYVAVFEVFPEIDLAPASGLSIERPLAEVAETDIDRMIENLRNQRKQWNSVERAAAEGDRVIIDFTGTIDGEVFEGGQATEYPLELGSGKTIPGFEDQLVGCSAGEEKSFEIQFPEDYQAEALRGKTARFETRVHRVEASSLPEIDEDFIRGFGVESGEVDGLRADIRRNMERELSQGLRTRLKRNVMDALLAAVEVDAPTALVKQEIERLKQQMAQQLQGAIDPATLNDALFQQEAERRVRLGLAIAEIVKQQSLKSDPERVRKHVEEMASAYEQPQQVVDYYYSRKELMDSVEALVLEEQVVDWLLDQSQVQEKSYSFDEVMNAQDNQQSTEQAATAAEGE